MLTLSHFLILGAVLFGIGIVGIFLNRKNLIIILMSIELMLLSVNLNFIAFSHYLQDLAGQVFVFLVLTVAATESAILYTSFVSSPPITIAPVAEAKESLPIAVDCSFSAREAAPNATA